MRASCFAFLVPVLVGASVSAQSVQPFIEAGGEGLCVSRGEERVCLRSVGADGDGRVEVRRRGGTVRWGSTLGYVGAQADLRAFRLDLADGGGGLVVAERFAVSNGMAVETWTLSVLPDDAAAPTYRFEARDIGPEGAPFAQWRGETVYWATDWQTADDPSGRRGSGYYLVGRPFQLGRNGLVPVTSLPVRSRRMLYNFRTEAAGPVAWLSDRRAESRRADPFWGRRPSGSRGEIVRVEALEDGAYALTVRLGARERTVRVGASSPAVRLGDGASGRLFPDAYRPSGLVGRSARLAPEVDGAAVVWLDE